MLRHKYSSALAIGLFWISNSGFLTAQESHQLSKPPTTSRIAAASNEGESAIKRFSLAPGFRAELVAAEPHLANPVAFSIDEQGRFYVAETFRHSAGVGDIRGIMDWLDEELAATSVDDRLAEMKRHLGDKIKDWTINPERVKFLEDRDGDGKVDFSSVYADGFTDPLDGIGAGVLARNGNVYFANIPSLWLLKDSNADGVADTRKSLHRGYGVRIGFLGHDLHGLCFGPDGRLYFSVGDRGASVTTEGRTVARTDSGAVFRCNPDGSDLELFAYGLRNPQELAFDEYGNLWTGDNNSDSGDKARWVYVVEGGDSGWRIGYQFLESPYSRGPFNAEKLWHPQHPGQAAYIVPPIANLANGPSGLAYYPGSGLANEYAGHFFLVDFTGSPANSGVHTFTVKPKGASFEIHAPSKFAWNILATDVEFGPNPGLYVSDWVQGWDQPGKGRIYRLQHTESSTNQLALQTQNLMKGGFGRKTAKELATLLGHIDMRVRSSSQFALASRGLDGLKVLAGVLKKDPRHHARIHAIWGLGQIAQIRSQIPVPLVDDAMRPVLAALSDKDPEIRAQAIRVLGDTGYTPAYEASLRLLADPIARVRFHALLAVGKLNRGESLKPVLSLLRENADQDVYIRHAAVMALTRAGDVSLLTQTVTDPSPAVRRGALLALRRLQRPEISLFLRDSDPSLVLEAARAINDEPIYGAQAELAGLIVGSSKDEPLLRRVLNANFRHGTAQTAAALALFASRADAPESMRSEAITCLADWPAPSGRDRVLGLWRPLAHARDVHKPVDALVPHLAGLFQSGVPSVQAAIARAAAKLHISQAIPALSQLAQNRDAQPQARLAALTALASFVGSELNATLAALQQDPDENLRKEVTRISASVGADPAGNRVFTALEKGSVGEQQAAFAAMGAMPGPEAAALLAKWLGKLMSGSVPDPLKLDILEAASKRSEKDIKDLLSRYEASLPKTDALTGYREVLFGGDASAGKKIFAERADVACIRCHQIDGEGGEVGPVLTGIGGRQKREYILEAILYPNRVIAKGFETLIVTMQNGSAYAGLVKSENSSELVLNSPEDGLLTLKKADIKTKETGLSGMPEELGKILTRLELRNLVEFLSTSR